MEAAELRSIFLSYFADNGHVVVPSASLIPHDPSLLFTVAAPTFAMTLLIYADGTQPYPDVQQTAWSTALVLLLFVLVLSGAARLVASRLTRRAR